MKAQLYKLLIEYEGYEKTIWRSALVSSNYPLSKVGYLVLAAFDTLANHLFYIEHEGIHYEMPLAEDDLEELNSSVDPTGIKLSKMDLVVGAKMTMVYDYGCEQTFNITLTEITDMPSGSSTMYPKIIEGAGKGILDNVSADEFRKIVKRIDEVGESTHMYYSPYGTDEIWDYRDFDIDLVNKTLKNGIVAIQHGYED